MDKIAKLLNRLTAKEKAVLKELLELVSSGEVKNLDIKKLKGNKNIYRVRSGDFRLIFMKDRNDKIFVLALERHSEKTYK